MNGFTCTSDKFYSCFSALTRCWQQCVREGERARREESDERVSEDDPVPLVNPFGSSAAEGPNETVVHIQLDHEQEKDASRGISSPDIPSDLDSLVKRTTFAEGVPAVQVRIVLLTKVSVSASQKEGRIQPGC